MASQQNPIIFSSHQSHTHSNPFSPPHQLSIESTSPPPSHSSVHLQIPSGAGTPASPPSDCEPYTAARTSTFEFFGGRLYSSNLRPLSLTHDRISEVFEKKGNNFIPFLYASSK